MKIEYLGHSCFLLQAKSGARFLTDPYDGIGYPMPRADAECVLCTHGHFDHHNLAGVRGVREVIENSGSYERGGVSICAVDCFHDDVRGAKRGKNVVFILEEGGVRVCHMGDIGELPRRDLIAAIGRVDVLLVPVGGTYTVDAEGALAWAEALRPLVTVPMHYCCEDCSLDIAPLSAFVQAAGEARCVFLPSASFDASEVPAWAGKVVIPQRAKHV